MVTLFRKLLIRTGKVIPFVLAFIVAFSHSELIYAIASGNMIEDAEGVLFYYAPISNYIGNVVYVDWFDVLLVFILCVALELCSKSFRCAFYLLLNLFVRFALEHFYFDEGIVVGIASVMALCGLYCACGGIRMLIATKK